MKQKDFLVENATTDSQSEDAVKLWKNYLNVLKLIFQDKADNTLMIAERAKYVGVIGGFLRAVSSPPTGIELVSVGEAIRILTATKSEPVHDEQAASQITTGQELVNEIMGTIKEITDTHEWKPKHLELMQGWVSCGAWMDMLYGCKTPDGLHIGFDPDNTSYIFDGVKAIRKKLEPRQELIQCLNHIASYSFVDNSQVDKIIRLSKLIPDNTNTETK